MVARLKINPDRNTKLLGWLFEEVTEVQETTKKIISELSNGNVNVDLLLILKDQYKQSEEMIIWILEKLNCLYLSNEDKYQVDAICKKYLPKNS